MSIIRRVAVVGSGRGGGAFQVIDALTGTDLIATAIFDVDQSLWGKSILGVPVVGDSATENIRDHHTRGVFDAAVIAVGGDLRERERVFVELREAGVATTNVVDPTVQIRSGAKLGTGNVILGGAYLGPGVEIGDNCYIINHTTIQHESIIGNHCYFSTGVALAGRVLVGDRVRFDTRSGSKANIEIGSDCMISAGCILTRNLNSGARVDPVTYNVVTNS